MSPRDIWREQKRQVSEGREKHKQLQDECGGEMYKEQVKCVYRWRRSAVCIRLSGRVEAGCASVTDDKVWNVERMEIAGWKKHEGRGI